jgi:hypothetical protein
MLKAIIVGATVFAGAGGTALWLKADQATKSASEMANMPSIQELVSSEYMKGLPVQEVREPF